VGDELESKYKDQNGEPIKWGNGDTIPWKNIEYHGCEITEEELIKADRPPVLLESDYDALLKKNN
jgi:hypothetical protein